MSGGFVIEEEFAAEKEHTAPSADLTQHYQDELAKHSALLDTIGADMVKCARSDECLSKPARHKRFYAALRKDRDRTILTIKQLRGNLALCGVKLPNDPRLKWLYDEY